MRIRGFTLVELTVAFVITAILAGLAVISFTALRSSTSDDNTQKLLSSLTPEQGDYYATFASFSEDPASLTDMYQGMAGVEFVDADTDATQSTVSVSKAFTVANVPVLVTVARSSSGTCFANVQFPQESVVPEPFTGLLSGVPCSAAAVMAQYSLTSDPQAGAGSLAPSGFTLTPGNTSVSVRWDALPNVAYSLKVTCLDSDKCTEPRNLNPGSSGVFTDTNVFAKVTYQYTLTASAGGASFSVGPLSATPLNPSAVNDAPAPAGALAPEQVTGVTATMSARGLTLSWNVPGDGGAPITRYSVRYRVSPDGPWLGYGSSFERDRTSALLTGLSTGVTYDVSVRAHNAVGAGKWSGAATPSEPLGLSYLQTSFSESSDAQELEASTTGGSGVQTFAYAGSLPPGVTFNTSTGTFTGPSTPQWFFKTNEAASGAENSCAVTTTGRVNCWGANVHGQLGDGTTTESTTPVSVRAVSGPGYLTGVSSVNVGKLSACALTTEGAVKCWGWNGNGQLGNGTKTSSSRPVDVAGLSSGVRSLVSGGEFMCAVLDTGGMKCWGNNINGQLGNNTTTQSSSPVVVKNAANNGDLTSVVSASAGESHVCAVLTSGAVSCWGNNSSGQLGNGTTTQRLLPRASNLTSGVNSLTSGLAHSCALLDDSSVKCWGNNINGQLGNNTTTRSSSPVGVLTLGSGVVSVAAGEGFSCALFAAGNVKCWGQNNWGQLGDGTRVNRSSPVAVTGLTSGVVSLAAGKDHACAVLSSLQTRCWGYNIAGQLGDGVKSMTDSDLSEVSKNSAHPGFPAPVTVTVTDASGSQSTSITLDILPGSLLSYPSTNFTSGVSGEVFTPVVVGGSGTNRFTSLGLLPAGVTFDRDTGAFTGPTFAQWNFKATQVGVGKQHACALTTAGTVKCWGNNANGKLGDGTTIVRSTPVDVVGVGGSGVLGGVSSISLGGANSCAVKNGSVLCWGSGSSGALGNGSSTASSTPVAVSGIANAVSVAVGEASSCAVLDTGSVKCWGANTSGKLGDGTTTSSNTPVAVLNLSDAKSVSVGVAHACAVTTAGEAKCWGNNDKYQLGSGTAGDKTSPVSVKTSGSGPVLTGVKAISAGNYTTCAVMEDKGVKCWGSGGYGQIGNGSTTPRAGFLVYPTVVIESGSNAAVTSALTVETKYDRSCALLDDGSVKCWGDNSGRQLGLGSTASVTSATQVTGLSGGVAQVETSDYHSCALLLTGEVKCWGLSGPDYYLGNGLQDTSVTPTPVSKTGDQEGFPATVRVNVVNAAGSANTTVVLGLKDTV
jgi:alpha-tubulin suppressor-like RCC1 family protein/Tfp pilus assembly protein PilE